MSDNKKPRTFSIYEIEEVATESSKEFFYARMCVLSTRPNSHKLLITSDILKRDGETIRGKWVVADTQKGELMQHSPNEYIVGIVPENARIEYVDDTDGNTYMYVDCILSKIYAKQLYDMFKVQDTRNVSVEMLTTDLEPLENGDIPIEGLNIVGVTILGGFVNGSCPDARIEVVRFSEQDAENYYNTVIGFSENNNNKEKDMQDTKVEEMAEEILEEKEDIIMSEDTETEMSESEPKEDVIEEEKEMAEKTEEENDDAEKEVEENDAEDKKEMGDENVEEVIEPNNSVEEMTFEGGFAPSEFAEEDKEEIEKMASMSAKEVVGKMLSLEKELAELKAFKDDVESAEKDKRLASIMSNVKEDLDEKTYSELKEEGEALSIDELGGFENKVKAFAYENAKKKNKKSDSDIMVFAGADIQTKVAEKELTADDIYNKYL